MRRWIGLALAGVLAVAVGAAILVSRAQLGAISQPYAWHRNY